MNTQTLKLYENRPDVTLTTYVLADSPELLNGKKRPAVLVCPGGAYLSCSDREAEPVALRFAAMGYQAFVLRYSTYYSGGRGVFPLTGTMEVNSNSGFPSHRKVLPRSRSFYDQIRFWIIGDEHLNDFTFQKNFLWGSACLV